MKRFSIIGRKLVVETTPPDGFTPAAPVATATITPEIRGPKPVPESADPAPVAVCEDFTGGPGITLEFNPIKQFWEIRFPGRPAPALREELKAARWRYWGPTQAWWNKGTDENKAFAEAYIARHSCIPATQNPQSIPAATIPEIPNPRPVPAAAIPEIRNPRPVPETAAPEASFAVRHDRKLPPGFTRAADRAVRGGVGSPPPTAISPVPVPMVPPVAMVALTQ